MNKNMFTTTQKNDAKVKYMSLQPIKVAKLPKHEKL